MNRALSMLAAFLAGIAVGWIVSATRDGSPRSEPERADLSPPSPGGVDDELRALLERVDARSERVLRALADAPAGRAPADEPVTAEGGPGEELRLLRELERSLAELCARPTDAGEALQRLRAERPEPDWPALDALVATLDADVEAARREVQLLSEPEVLRRYGSPSLTYVRDGVVRWVYGRDYVPQWDAYRLQLVLAFEGGLVRTVYVERE